MKHSLSFIKGSLMLCMVSIILIFSCQTKPREDGGHDQEDSTNVSDDPNRYDSAKKHLITVAQALEMYQAYQPRYKAVSEVAGKEDATYGWQSIQFYKQYIEFLETEAAKHKIKISGLRLYFAAYPEQGYGKSSGYMSYMLVPTYFDEKTQSHKAFDLYHIDPKTNVPIDWHEVLTNGAPHDMAMNAGDADKAMFMKTSVLVGEQSSSSNFAMMCQPYCN